MPLDPYQSSPFLNGENPDVYSLKANDFILLLAEGLPQIQALQEAGLPFPTKPHARYLLEIPSLRTLYDSHRTAYEALEAKLTPTSMRSRLEALDYLALQAKKLDLSLEINKELSKLSNLYPKEIPAPLANLPVTITVTAVSPTIIPQDEAKLSIRDNLTLDSQPIEKSKLN